MISRLLPEGWFFEEDVVSSAHLLFYLFEDLKTFFNDFLY